MSDTLHLEEIRKAVVDDVSLLNYDQKEDATTASAVRSVIGQVSSPRFLTVCYAAMAQLHFGPPFAPYSFESIPVESYPPQVLCRQNRC